MDQRALIVAGTEIRVGGRVLRTARIEGDKYEFLNDAKPLIAKLPECGHRVDLFTFMQGITDPQPRYSYHLEWDNLAAVPVSTFDNWWTRQVDPTVRNRVRKAEKMGVEVREMPFDDNFIQGISRVYNESPIRQGKRFTHYQKSIDEIRRVEGTFRDRSVFLGAYLDGQMIGFVKLVSDSAGTQAGLMNILSMIEHRDKAPTNALVAQAIRSCATRGISYLVYGNYTHGNKHTDSLHRFKKKNGFKQIDLPRYYVPLTTLGSVALRLGLHHRLVDRLPEPLLTKALELRSLWHTRKLQTSTEVS